MSAEAAGPKAALQRRGRLSRWGPLLLVVALGLVFTGERILAGGGGLGAGRALCTGLGTATLLVLLAIRALEWVRAEGGARAAAGRSLAGYGLVVVGVALYALSMRETALGMGMSWNAAGDWTTLWTVAWVIVLLVGTLLALFADWSRSGLEDPRRVEVARVRAASAGAVSLGLALSWVVALNYVAEGNDVEWHWSSLARPLPSEGTELMVQQLPEPVEIALFFPPASEVLERIEPYFERLASLSERVSVQRFDRAVEPKKATEYGVRSNGDVFFVRGTRRERIDLAVDLKGARHKLKNLDRKVQKALLKVARERTTLYMTVGHDEREGMRDKDTRPKVKVLKDELRAMNVSSKRLGFKAGLGKSVPPDATVVAIVDPRRPFLPEEVQSLVTWFETGGSLLLLLEPGSDHGLDPLFEVLGLQIPRGVVAHPKIHLVESRGPADTAYIISNNFGSHATTSQLSRARNRYAAALFGAGILRERLGKGVKHYPLVRPMSGSWFETDGDFKQGEAEGEPEGALAMAVTKGEGEGQGRAVVIADADMAADRFLAEANLELLLQSYTWLAREDEVSLKLSAPKRDQPLVHTRDEDRAMFWTTVAGVPLLVLAGGLLWVRRRRSGPRTTKEVA